MKKSVPNNEGESIDGNKMSNISTNPEQVQQTFEQGMNDEDFDNMNEIENVLGNFGSSEDYADYNSNQYNDSIPSPQGNQPYNASLPSQNGRLSTHAAEFWFPECRNCTCCKGNNSVTLKNKLILKIIFAHAFLISRL